MRTYKYYTFLFFALVTLVLLFHFVVWNLYTSHVFPVKHNIGDLGRMSYKLDSLQARQKIVTLDKQHISFDGWKGERIDILTIGDSFSNGGGEGENAYYQDHLASKYDLNILNIQNVAPANNYLETIYMLNNSGLLDELKPKIILFESTEWQVLNRFSNIMNKTITEDKENILKSLKSLKYKSSKAEINFINNLNYNAFFYNIAYDFDDNAYKSNCYITKLNGEFFSSKDNKSLLFYKHTIKYNKSITKEKVNKLNENLNSLANVLEGKNIKLYFMPAVDKFNLYEKYLIDNKYGKSSFFELLRKMPKNYKLIDTKAILEKKVDKGVKDIFYADDTHWSYKASEAIADSLQELKSLK